MKKRVALLVGTALLLASTLTNSVSIAATPFPSSEQFASDPNAGVNWFKANGVTGATIMAIYNNISNDGRGSDSVISARAHAFSVFVAFHLGDILNDPATTLAKAASNRNIFTDVVAASSGSCSAAKVCQSCIKVCEPTYKKITTCHKEEEIEVCVTKTVADGIKCHLDCIQVTCPDANPCTTASFPGADKRLANVSTKVQNGPATARTR